jgi:hypothetical protein
MNKWVSLILWLLLATPSLGSSKKSQAEVSIPDSLGALRKFSFDVICVDDAVSAHVKISLSLIKRNS